MLLQDFITCKFGKSRLPFSFAESSSPVTFFGFSAQFKDYEEELKYLLDGQELSRLAKFRRKEDRLDYLVSHAALRKIISEKMVVPVDRVQFNRGAQGKPLLEGLPVCFNISHSYGAFAIAIYRYSPVGVDIEKIREYPQLASVARKFFSKEEREFIFNTVTKEPDPNRFYLLWTRKESLLKGTGAGLIDSLEDLQVLRETCQLSDELFDTSIPGEHFHDWFVFSTQVESYALSIAVQNSQPVSLIHYSPAAMGIEK